MLFYFSLCGFSKLKSNYCLRFFHVDSNLILRGINFLTFFTEFTLIIGIATLTNRATICRYANTTVLTRVANFAGIAGVAPQDLQPNIRAH